MANGEQTELHKELSLKTERVQELELEKEALNKKVAGIEASLARWIFRACDYKSEVTKLSERCASNEQFTSDMSAELSSVNVQLAEWATKISELEASLADKIAQVSELDALWKSAQVKLASLSDEKDRRDAQTQTQSSVVESARLVSNKTSGLVAQTAAKLHQLINSTSIEKDDTRVETRTAPVQSTSSSSLETAGSINQKRVESLTSEIAQLKSKLDTLILEKNSYKCKNEELTSDLNSLKQTLLHSSSTTTSPTTTTATTTPTQVFIVITSFD